MKSQSVRKHPGNHGLFNSTPIVLLSVLLCCATIVVYWPLKNNDFINLDDNLYITENEIVKQGVSAEGIRWAFQFNDKGYWQPLTWLSHMLDCELFGLNPGGHHFSSLMIHLGNTLLLFWILNRVTSCVYRSALVAALFALHPLNVESVAWVGQRKNVLNTFFWFATIFFYTCYVRKRDIRFYGGMLTCFVLGLMAKPMAVTLPFLLLLLDFWPLRRLEIGSLKMSSRLLPGQPEASSLNQPSRSIIFIEKLPLLVLSLGSILLSIFSLRQMQILISDSLVPIKLRLANALISYISYIKKLFWPHELAIFYPFSEFLALWPVLGAVTLMAVISLLSIVVIRRRPYFFVGWFWYVGTLLPVIGLVQTGLWPAMADRWTYVPAIGLFMAIVWFFADFCRKFNVYRLAFMALFAVVLLGLSAQTRNYLAHWTDSTTLFKHTLQVTGNNAVAYYSLGDELVKQGKLGQAIEHYRSALRLKPQYSRVHNNLGVALAQQGETDQAVTHFQSALEINPNYADAHNNMGAALRDQGQMRRASNHFLQAIRLDPRHANSHNNLGILLMRQAKYQTAEIYFKKAIAIKPNFDDAHENLKKTSAELEKFKNAVDRLIEEQNRQPENYEICLKLADLYEKYGALNAAANQCQRALSSRPGFLPALERLAILYARLGKYENAIGVFNDMLAINPDLTEPYYAIAAIHARQKKIDRSTHWLKKAVAKGFDDWDHLKQDPNFDNIRNTPYFQNLTRTSRSARSGHPAYSGN